MSLDDRPELRVSDAERQHVVDRLREETTAGRLTLDEFDERLTEAYSARTRADLTHVLRELPDDAITSPAPAPVPVPASIDDLPPELEAKARRRHRRNLRGHVAGFACTNGTCIAIWGMTGAGYFWPQWVLFGTGIGLFMHLVRGADNEREEIRRALKRAAKEEQKHRLAEGST